MLEMIHPQTRQETKTSSIMANIVAIASVSIIVGKLFCY